MTQKKEISNVNVYVNELGTVVPNDVIETARKHGIKTSSYLYEEGKYGATFPAASIGGKSCARFRSGNYAAYMVDIGSGFVAFSSPSNLKDSNRGRRL